MGKLQRNLFEERFWLELRDRTTLKGKVGKDKCAYWCYIASDLLDGENSGHGFVNYIAYRSKGWPRTMDCHLWLESPVGRKRFIADGTAGQIDKEYPEGFYGFLNKAPDRLRTIYETEH